MEDEGENNKKLLSSCAVSEALKQQSEFAAVCSFIHHFGTELGIYLTFPQLVQFLTLSHDVNWNKWETLHIKLLNKLKYRARPERWEPVLGRFLQVHARDVEDLLLAGDMLQRCSGQTSATATPKPVQTPQLAYYKLEFPVRTKVLLLLLETQFDRNQAFKDKVNLRSAADLRFRPLGSDVWGRTYWLLKDSELNILLYREESNHEQIKLVCETTDEIRQLHRELKDVCPPESKLADILAIQCAPSESLLETVANALLCDNITTTADDLSNSMVLTTDQEAKPFPESPRTPPPTPIACVVNGSIEKAISPNLSIKAEDMESDVKVSPSCADATGDQVGETTVPNTTTESFINPESIKVDPHSFDENIVTADTPAIVNGECTQPTVKAKKGRSNKRTTTDVPNGNDLTENSVEVRRSGRQRKPVEFLTMEPLQPKRARSTVKATKPQEVDAKDVQDVEAPKPIKKRKLKSSEPQTANTLVDEHSKESKHKRKRKKKRKRHHKASGHSNPWLQPSSSSESLDEDDTFEHELLQRQFADSSDSDTPRTKKKANSVMDWSDKPESDFNPDDVGTDSDVDSLTQGRNLARQKRLQRKLSTEGPGQLVSEPETQCQICFRSHLPEWMLLCDRCDLGHHAMCLRPPLLIIPEGDWFCPRCQHATLVTTLIESADAIDVEQKKQTLFKRMQERLNYVNISMTNILADEEEENVDAASRTRKRMNQNILYRESESSAELSEEPSSEAESFASSDDEAGYWGHNRRTRRPKRSTRGPRFRRATRTRRRSRLDSGSEGEATVVTSDSVSGHSPVPAPRSTRKRQAQYDLSEAFKQLDEVLEEDEKYQEEKRRRKCRKTNASDASENEAELPETSDRPAGRSRGKDLSNILGPDWKDWEPSKSRSRRRRVVARLSSSSEASEGEGKGHHDTGDDDEDFKPPSDASSLASELESDEPSSSDVTSSDNSWLCVSRHARRTKSRSTRKSHRHSTGRRIRGKPIPRFEASEDEESLSRPKRRTRTVVSYQESDDQDEDDPPPQKRNLRARWELSDDDEREKAANDEFSDVNENGSPDHVSSTSHVERKNRRRILSSSESEYQPQDDATDEEFTEKHVQTYLPPPDVQIKPCSQEMPSGSECSDEFSSSKLKISESSPEQSPKFERPVSKDLPISSTLPPVDAPALPNAPCILVAKPDNSESNLQSPNDEDSGIDKTVVFVPNRPHTQHHSPTSTVQAADHLVVNESPDLFD